MTLWQKFEGFALNGPPTDWLPFLLLCIPWMISVVLHMIIAPIRDTYLQAHRVLTSRKREKAASARAADIRLEIANEVLLWIEQQKAFQATCSHHRPEGLTHLVLVHGADGPYLLCQRCQVIIPSSHPRYVEWLSECEEQYSYINSVDRRWDDPSTDEDDVLYTMPLENLKKLCVEGQ